MTITNVVAVMVLALSAQGAGSSAYAQFYWCPAGSQPVSGGGGTMCQCPDGSFAGINGCAAVQRPYVPPPTIPSITRQREPAAETNRQPVGDVRLSQTAGVLKSISSFLSGTGKTWVTDRQINVPGALPSGWPGIEFAQTNTVQMQVVQWNPMAGAERDPFRPLPNGSSNVTYNQPAPHTASGALPSIFDPSQIVRLQPPAPAVQTPAPQTAPTFVGPKDCTGFYAPDGTSPCN